MRRHRIFLAGYVLLFSMFLLVSCGSDDPAAPAANQAPGVPTIDTASGAPATGATDVQLAVQLHWSCSDPEGDPLSYTVHFGTAAQPPMVSEDQAGESFAPSGVANGTTYYWKVVAADGDATTSSPVWSFTTVASAAETISQPLVVITSPVEIGQLVSATALDAVSSSGHPLQYRFDWGDGSQSPWTSSSSAQHSWSAAGEVQVKGQARCAEHTSIESQWSDPRTVTISAEETVTTPDAPAGPVSAEIGENLTYTTTGAVSSRGHALEYRFDWGNGFVSPWSTNLYAHYTWNTANTYELKVQARCQLHPTVESEWSAALSVDIHDPAEIVTLGGRAVGPTNGVVGADQTFLINWPATSNLGHDVEYHFDWGDGSLSDWSTELQGTHAWSTTGSYVVRLQARCIEHPSVVSVWKDSDPIEIADGGETLSEPGTFLTPSYTGIKVFIQYIYTTNPPVTSSYGDPVQYRVDWGQGEISEWQDSPGFAHTYNVTGQFILHVQARCKIHPDVMTEWGPDYSITVIEGN